MSTPETSHAPDGATVVDRPAEEGRIDHGRCCKEGGATITVGGTGFRAGSTWCILDGHDVVYPSSVSPTAVECVAPGNLFGQKRFEHFAGVPTLRFRGGQKLGGRTADIGQPHPLE